jgi:hypothetical protein
MNAQSSRPSYPALGYVKDFMLRFPASSDYAVPLRKSRQAIKDEG